MQERWGIGKRKRERSVEEEAEAEAEKGDEDACQLNEVSLSASLQSPPQYSPSQRAHLLHCTIHWGRNSVAKVAENRIS